MAPPAYLTEQPMTFGTEGGGEEQSAFGNEQPSMFATGGGGEDAPPSQYNYEEPPQAEGEQALDGEEQQIPQQ